MGEILLDNGRVIHAYKKQNKTTIMLHFNNLRNLPFTTGEIPIAMPQLYDYFFDDEKLEWIPWNQLVPAYIHDPERKFIDILVPTLDTVRATWLLNLQVGTHHFSFSNFS